MTGSRAVIAAVIVALGLAGCSSEDPEPKVAPSTPSSPSTSTVAEPEAPELPEAAKGTDAAAAEAFVEFYWEMVNYAQRTGDTKPLRDLGRDCVNCESGVDFIEGVHSGGGEIRGGDGTPRSFDTSFTRVQGTWMAVVDCVLALTPQDVDVPGQKGDEHYAGGNRDIRMYLEPDGASWIVRTMGFP